MSTIHNKIKPHLHPIPPNTKMSALLQYSSSSSLFLLLLIIPASAQNPVNEAPISFHLSIAVVVGVFSIMFSLTFLLLMYVKFCNSSLTAADPATASAAVDSHRTTSGIDRAVIDSLPFFRFSSLKGSRHGLECAVCLSKFHDEETLRLLPKCKHAFHVACVDRWLESHSTCPLCRCRIDPHDAEVVKFSTSWRFLNIVGESNNTTATNSARLDDEVVEIFVEREKLNKFRHRIVVSDVVLKSRWSDVDLSDIEAMSSDLLMPSKGSLEEEERGRDKRMLVNSGVGNRCMSEIAEVSRFEVREKNGLDNNDDNDAKVRRVWLPIARRTAEWFAGRGRRDGVSMEDSSRVDSNV